MMKQALAILLLAWSLTAMAAGSRYVMRVDGLVCPYCAYGVEKKLRQIEGVGKIDIDLDKGLVTVEVVEGVELGEEQMRQLFRDAGFTWRSMTRQDL